MATDSLPHSSISEFATTLLLASPPQPSRTDSHQHGRRTHPGHPFVPPPPASKSTHPAILSPCRKSRVTRNESSTRRSGVSSGQNVKPSRKATSPRPGRSTERYSRKSLRPNPPRNVALHLDLPDPNQRRPLLRKPTYRRWNLSAGSWTQSGSIGPPATATKHLPHHP